MKSTRDWAVICLYFVSIMAKNDFLNKVMKTYLFNDFWGTTDQFFQRSTWLVRFAMNVGCFSLRQIPWTFISNLMKLEATTVSNVASHSQRGQPSNDMLGQFIVLLSSVLVVASSSKGSKKFWSTKRTLTLRKHVHFARKSLRTHEALRLTSW